MEATSENNAARFEGKPRLALTPPMGWNSWNCFRCYDIDEAKLLEVADAMVTSGMLKAGFDTFVVDDCWQALSRDGQGRLRSPLFRPWRMERPGHAASGQPRPERY